MRATEKILGVLNVASQFQEQARKDFKAMSEIDTGKIKER